MSIETTTTKEQQKTYYVAKTISITAALVGGISFINYLGAYRAYKLACVAILNSVDIFAVLSTQDSIPSEYLNKSLIDNSSGVEYYFSDNDRSITISPNETRKSLSALKLEADSAMSYSIAAATTAYFIYSDPLNLDFSDQHLCKLTGIETTQCQLLTDYLEKFI